MRGHVKRSLTQSHSVLGFLNQVFLKRTAFSLNNYVPPKRQEKARAPGNSHPASLLHRSLCGANQFPRFSSSGDVPRGVEVVSRTPGLCPTFLLTPAVRRCLHHTLQFTLISTLPILVYSHDARNRAQVQCRKEFHLSLKRNQEDQKRKTAW